MSRITVNLAPADKRKEGPIYDLPILLAILTASGQLSCDLSDCAMIGELSLSGEIHGIRGVLPMAIHAKELGISPFVCTCCQCCRRSCCGRIGSISCDKCKTAD